jgi:CHAT domain-containing protein
MDEEGWGSIAAALLDAGTAQVVATDRPVDDAATLAMMREFYAQADWPTDPARALARVQQARDAAAPGAPEAPWAAFSVLGRPPFIP